MRQLVYDRLRLDSAVAALVGDRIKQGESMDVNELTRPFIVYRIGNDTSENFSEDDQQPGRTYFQVYIHDSPADYMRIDDLVTKVIRALRGGPYPEYNVLRIEYLETSRDLGDETMRTILRYVRFQAVRSDL